MSITKDFEKRRIPVPKEEWSEHGTFKYWGDDIEWLLKHTRALEAMLKKHEWSGSRDWGSASCCLECDALELPHEPDCPLAKLLEGVE